MCCHYTIVTMSAPPASSLGRLLDPLGSEQPGAESAAESDGPGGHADEPGNPNANNEFQGQQ